MADKSPSSGYFEGRKHIYPVRVFYEDTDYVEKEIMKTVYYKCDVPLAL